MVNFDQPAPSTVSAEIKTNGRYCYVLYVRGTKLAPAGNYATSQEALEMGRRRLKELDPEA
jgi:hypothetical protein